MSSYFWRTTLEWERPSITQGCTPLSDLQMNPPWLSGFCCAWIVPGVDLQREEGANVAGVLYFVPLIEVPQPSLLPFSLKSVFVSISYVDIIIINQLKEAVILRYLTHRLGDFSLIFSDSEQSIFAARFFRKASSYKWNLELDKWICNQGILHWKGLLSKKKV